MTAAVAETHVSVVFFAGDRAYKLLKPVDLGFLDHTDTATRIAAVDREIALNRRLAPDVYLGAADVVEHGELADRMLVMRRLPDDRRLTRLLAGPDAEAHLVAVARAVAAFHAGQPAIRDAESARRDTFARLWEENLDVLAASPDVDAARVARARRLAEEYLGHHGDLFEARMADGHVVDGHGDLLAEDIFVLDDGPRILDCLAFRDDLRITDVLADVAFLAMDVHRLAGPVLAGRFVRAYREFTGETHPASLAHHYVAYRASVRAKVAALTAASGVGDTATHVASARRHLELVLHHLERGRVRAVLLGGGPGTGKTTLARAVGAELGWVHLSTDELRKDLAGVARTARPADLDVDLYTPERTHAVYAALLEEARSLVERGESVVLDASWTATAERDEARRVLTGAGALVREIECRLPTAVAEARLRDRDAAGDDASDATAELVEPLTGRREPWPQAEPVDTGPPTERVRRRLIDALAGDLAAGAGADDV